MRKGHEDAFNPVGERWRKRLDTVTEYEIVEEGLERHSATFIPRAVSYQEYQQAEGLKNELLKRFKGIPLEDVIQGKEIKTENGICYKIEQEDSITLNIIDSRRARAKILSNLKLIYGIGEVTEELLKNEGYKTIEDLTSHSRFGSEALRFLELLDKCDISRIIDWVTHWVPRAHPLVLYTSSFHRKEDFLILDIETLGLFTRPIILIGVAEISGNTILISQYFPRAIKEEPATLRAFLSHVNVNSVFITFNGKSFDLPYIKERLAYYGMYEDFGQTHFDILHFSRRAWKEGLPDCRLTTMERYLFDIERKDDVPSALVPEFYETYMRSGNAGVLIPIIEHNRQDLVTLANIFSRLNEEWG